MIGRLLGTIFGALMLMSGAAHADEAVGFDKKVDELLTPISEFAVKIIFFSVPLFGESVPLVLLLLAGTAIFLTLYFGFINLRSFGLALRTVRGKYSEDDDPGQITHFQALSTAVSATVGLGNIAGVAIAISVGGPGAVFWMVFMGLMGMTSKFTECTLGVKYRIIDAKGQARGGGMYYLRDGLKERGFPTLGRVLAVLFAIACIGGAVGAGNMFQSNQAYTQVSNTFGIFSGESGGVWFGLVVAVVVGAVILGGIVSIARVTSFLVPFMCITYLIACVIVLAGHAAEVPAAFGTIVSSAFSNEAAAGGFIGALIQGIRRGVFSNEAGVGSAAMAHAAVKTQKPASEGIVALLEPFIDTVVVCTMTALVVVVTGTWRVNSEVTADQVELRAEPNAASEIVATYEKGAALKLGAEWRALPSGEWIKSAEVALQDDGTFASAEGEKVQVFALPGDKDPVREEAISGLADGEVWSFLSDPDKASGFALTGSVAKKGGIWMTSRAFESVISWFPYVLALAVFLFAFSTMISWSYYGEQAVGYLFDGSALAVLIYKFSFCVFIVIGSAASLGSVIDLSDAMFFAMVVPNLIGLYLLLPVVKTELAKFKLHAAEIDQQQG